MTRLTWLAVFVMCGCQGQPVLEVSLGGKAFEVKDAVFFSVVHHFGPPTTFVVFGDQPGLCRAFEDPRNVCNARIDPHVRDGLFGALSRPVDLTRPLGWLVLRSATEGPATVVKDDLELSTPGATLTEGPGSVLHAAKNHAVIEQLVAGDAAIVSFESELDDGRAFRGRVEAGWCPALDMVRRHTRLERPAGTSGSFSYDDTQRMIGRFERSECEGETIESQCRGDATGVTCTCVRDGVTSTCAGTSDANRSLVSCCNLRFGI
ncbi:MAG: hypothetical protein GQE15_21645 [Archangiaceae bacterium]|nr:hypothetical protein [Archangiaceae bacterium]